MAPSDLQVKRLEVQAAAAAAALAAAQSQVAALENKVWLERSAVTRDETQMLLPLSLFTDQCILTCSAKANARAVRRAATQCNAVSR